MRKNVCCSYTCALYYRPKKGFSIDTDGYKQISVRGALKKEHRYIYEQHHGVLLTPSMEIHHLNRDRADNRIENLVAVTKQQHLILHGMVTKERAIEIMKEFLATYEKHTIKVFEENMGMCVETITRKLGSWNEAKEICGKRFGI